jgi:H+/gluconate symporter-like permease
MEAPTATPPPTLPSRKLSDEEGAQAVEYAMVGALGVGSIGLLWQVISRTGILDRIIQALLSGLVELIGQWL